MIAPQMLLTADLLPVLQLFLGWQELIHADIWI